MANWLKGLQKVLLQAHSPRQNLPLLCRPFSTSLLHHGPPPHQSQSPASHIQNDLFDGPAAAVVTAEGCIKQQSSSLVSRRSISFWSGGLETSGRGDRRSVADPMLQDAATVREFASQAGTLAVQASVIEPSEKDRSASVPGMAAGSSARFYKVASAEEGGDGRGGWVVKLDEHMLRTPAKRVLRLPTRELALAIAAEWDWQDKYAIRPFTMPLMKLAATAIDQIPLDRERVIKHLLKYFHTDTLCIRAPEPSLLADKQAEMWDPLLSWVEGELGGVRMVATSSLLGAEQPPPVMAAMNSLLRSLNDFELAAVDSLAGSGRSLIAALAVARARLNSKEAVTVVRLEEDFQAEEWGFVEGGHDIDIADMRVRMIAPSVFLRLAGKKS